MLETRLCMAFLNPKSSLTRGRMLGEVLNNIYKIVTIIVTNTIIWLLI